MPVSRPSLEQHPPIVVNDGTLVCGHALGLELGLRDRIALARALEAAGVDEIEIPGAALHAGEADAAWALARALKRARIIACGRISEQDVDTAIQCGFDITYLREPLSSAEFSGNEGLARLRRVITHARERGAEVCVAGADASRCGLDRVCRAVVAAEEAGAVRFRFEDTDGLMDPFACYAVFRRLCAETDLELEFQGRNGLGLATANTLAAVRGGATHVSVCALGRGERAGTAALDEVVAALSEIAGVHTQVDPAQLPALADVVANAWRRARPRSGPHASAAAAADPR